MTNTVWIAVKFGSDIHVPQRINSKEVGDPLTFPLVPSSGKGFHLFIEIAELNYCIEQNIVKTFMVPK